MESKISKAGLKSCRVSCVFYGQMPAPGSDDAAVGPGCGRTAGLDV